MQRWFTGWMSGYQGQQEHPVREVDGVCVCVSISNSQLQEEEEELLEELGYEDPAFGSTHKDSLLLRLSFTLSRGSLSLLSTPSPNSPPSLGPEPLLSLSFSSLCASLDLRPKVRGATFDLSLGGLSLSDDADCDSVFHVLVGPKGEEVRV